MSNLTIIDEARALIDPLTGHSAERDALARRVERLTEALRRLLNEAELDGMENLAGWDCWMHHARAALQSAGTP